MQALIFRRVLAVRTLWGEGLHLRYTTLASNAHQKSTEWFQCRRFYVLF